MLERKVRQAWEQGRYRDAIHLAKDIDELSTSLWYSSLAEIMLGNFSIGVEQARSALEISKDNRKHMFNSLVVLAHAYMWQGKSLAIETVNEAYEILKNEDEVDQFWRGFLLYVEAINEYSPNRYQNFEEYNEKTTQFLNVFEWEFLACYQEFVRLAYQVLNGNYSNRDKLGELENRVQQSNYQLLLGYVQIGYGIYDLMKGNMSDFQQAMETGYHTWKTIEFALADCYYYSALGLINFNSGNYKQAMKWYQHALHASNELGSEFSHGSYFRFIGEIYFRRGDLRNALINYRSSLKIRESNQEISGLGETYSHMGKLFKELSEQELAISYFNKGLEVRRQVGTLSGIASSLELLGEFYLEIGDFENAKYHLEESLAIFRKYHNLQRVTRNLFSLFRLDVYSGSETSATYEELQTLIDEFPDAQYLIQLAEALLSTRSTRTATKITAQNQLKEILSNYSLDFDLAILTLIELINNLLWELETTDNDEDIITEIKEYSAKIEEIARSQSIPSLLVEVEFFQAKLLEMQGDREQAITQLLNAEKISTKHGLKLLSIQISNLIDTLLHLQPDTKNSNLSAFGSDHKFKKFSDSKTNTTLGVNKPIMLLLLNKSGSAIYSFKMKGELLVQENLIGRLITTIQQLSSETLNQQGSIERIAHQQFTLLIKKNRGFIWCFVIEGSSYQAIQQFDMIIQLISLTNAWKQLLANSIGISHSMIEELNQVIETILHTSSNYANLEADTTSVDPKLPKKLLEYKFLLHPVRLAILNTLNKYFRYISAELREFLGITWGTFDDHVKALARKGYIEIQKEFVNETPTNILYLSALGSNEFATLQDLMLSLFESI